MEDTTIATNNNQRRPSIGSGVVAHRPSAIDNTDIQDPKNSLLIKPNLLEGEHFVLVPRKAWKLFDTWYGGGPEFPRKVVSIGEEPNKIKRVEIYPVFLEIYKGNMKSTKSFQMDLNKRVFSSIYCKQENFLKVKESACKHYHLSQKTCRIWIKDDDIWRLIVDNDYSLEDLRITSGDVFIIEELDSSTNTWKWREQEPRSWSNFEEGDSIDVRDRSKKWKRATIVQINNIEGEILVKFEGSSLELDEKIKFHCVCNCEWTADVPAPPDGCLKEGHELAKLGTYTISRASNRRFMSKRGSILQSIKGKSSIPGLTGIENLGNTCL